MRLTFLTAVALIAALGTAPRPAFAAAYSWSVIAGGGLTGSGLLTTGATDGGGFDITAFTGTIGGVAVDLLGGDPGTATTSPRGAFIYDNILFAQTNPLLSSWGILFSIGGQEGNIWGNGTPGSYSYYTYDGSSYSYADDSVSFSIAPIVPAAPEPSALAIFAVGLLGWRLLRRRPAAAGMVPAEPVAA